MKALVTGAAGFIGSHLTEALLAAGHQVVGVDCFIDYYPREVKERNLAAARKSPQYRFVEASLVDCDVDALVEGADWVFHQAAQAGVRASWGDDFRIYSDNNVYATQRLLEACRRRFHIAPACLRMGSLPMKEGNPYVFILPLSLFFTDSCLLVVLLFKQQ